MKTYKKKYFPKKNNYKPFARTYLSSIDKTEVFRFAKGRQLYKCLEPYNGSTRDCFIQSLITGKQYKLSFNRSDAKEVIIYRKDSF